jgi:beta-galactosidase
MLDRNGCLISRPGLFTLLAAEAPVLAWRVHHDEDAELYLNGIETARLPRWTPVYIPFKLLPEAVRTLKLGGNVIAMHCRQVSGGQFIDAGLLEYAAPVP